MTNSAPIVSNPSPFPTTDPIAVAANKTVANIFSDAVSAAENAAIIAQPWLGYPILKNIWEDFFGWVVNLISVGLGTEASFVVMDVQKMLDLTQAAKALTQLRAAQISGDPNALSKANADADAAVTPILHYIGSGST